MADAQSVPDLTATATVAVPIDQAFEHFTGRFASWWPTEYHIGQTDMAGGVIEPHVGGRWYELGTDGSQCDWGRVRAWEPPHRLVLTWQINGEWSFDADPDHASEIEVRFREDGPEQTVVELEHRHLDRLVGGQAIHDAIEYGGGGWGSVLDRYAKDASGAG